MTFSFQRVKNSQFWAGSLLLAVTATALAVSSHWLSPTQGEVMPASNFAAAALQSHGAPALSPLKSVLFTIHSEGFEPNEITLPAGKYVFVVDNRSGSEDVQLNLRRGQSEKLKEAKLTRKEMDWNSVVELAPGQYTLIDLNRPNWSADIKVSPK